MIEVSIPAGPVQHNGPEAAAAPAGGHRVTRAPMMIEALRLLDRLPAQWHRSSRDAIIGELKLAIENPGPDLARIVAFAALLSRNPAPAVPGERRAAIEAAFSLEDDARVDMATAVALDAIEVMARDFREGVEWPGETGGERAIELAALSTLAAVLLRRNLAPEVEAAEVERLGVELAVCLDLGRFWQPIE